MAEVIRLITSLCSLTRESCICIARNFGARLMYLLEPLIRPRKTSATDWVRPGETFMTNCALFIVGDHIIITLRYLTIEHRTHCEYASSVAKGREKEGEGREGCTPHRSFLASALIVKKQTELQRTFVVNQLSRNMSGTSARREIYSLLCKGS